MSAVRLAARYAKSLIDLAIEKNALEQVHADMLLFNETASHAGFKSMLKSPIINADKKMNVLEQLFKSKVSPITYAFYTLLVKKGREIYLSEISTAFIEQYNLYNHITKLKLTTAMPMDAKVVDSIVSQVKQKAKLEKVELVTEVDDSLIGGFVVQYEDKLFDASISKRLQALRKEYSDNAYVKKF
ncbi:MAG: ATP synthase F1 subunit delta [Chitinophagales bacterium]|nr:ATP synthase F1 subunit delta [Chitinophagales bacterium]